MSDILNDTEWMESLFNQMKPDEAVFPFGVKIGKNYYKIGDISNPQIFKDTSVTQSNFKVVFGSIYNMFRNASFPINKASQYTILKRTQKIDNSTQVNTLFFVFESDYIDDNNITVFDELINENYEMLFQYVSSVAESNRRRVLESFYNNNNY